MHYPTPSLAVRMFALRPSPKGNPRAVFRSNPLIPKSLWGQPVLYWRDKHTPDLSRPDEFIPNPTLVYSNQILPMVYYLHCLQATEHYPDDASPYSIEYFPPANCPIPTLQIHSRGADYQAGLVSVRDAVILEAFEKLGFSMSVRDMLQTLALRTGVGQSLIRKVLAAKGYVFDEPKSVPRSMFDTSAEWRFKYKILRTAVQSARNMTVTTEGSFHINDLYVEGAQGGYATHCPVTGLELNWDVFDSYRAPRVGRYDLHKGYTPGNVLIMSKYAKRVIERTGDPKTLLPFLNENPEILNTMNEWAQANPTTTDGVTALKLAMNKPKRQKQTTQTNNTNA